jgi:putative flippase GtrA
MNWIRIIRNAAMASVGAFIISTILMFFLNSRVNWSQQGTTAVLFFLGISVVYFLQERKAAKQMANNQEPPENHE